MDSRRRLEETPTLALPPNVCLSPRRPQRGEPEQDQETNRPEFHTAFTSKHRLQDAQRSCRISPRPSTAVSLSSDSGSLSDVEWRYLHPVPGDNSSTIELIPPKYVRVTSAYDPPAQFIPMTKLPPRQLLPTLEISKPNYKHWSLRWPFHVGILILIGGLFALLEVEIRRLPEPDYSALGVDKPVTILPSRGRILKESPNRSATLPFLPTETLFATTTSFTSVAVTPAPLVREVKRVKPQRQSEAAYPPGLPEYRYCGWQTPVWVIAYEEGVRQNANLQGRENLVHDLNANIGLVAVANPNPEPDPRPPASLYPSPGPKRSRLYQQIPTFLTDKDSWCPCNMSVTDSHGIWDILDVGREWETADKDCESVMNAIQTFNRLGRTGPRQISSTFTFGVAGPSPDMWVTVGSPHVLDSALIDASTMVVSWIPLFAGPDGDIVLPLEPLYVDKITISQEDSTDVRDVFGNELTSPFSGLVAATRHPTDTMPGDNVILWTIPMGRPQKKSSKTEDTPIPPSTQSPVPEPQITVARVSETFVSEQAPLAESTGSPRAQSMSTKVNTNIDSAILLAVSSVTSDPVMVIRESSGTKSDRVTATEETTRSNTQEPERSSPSQTVSPLSGLSIGAESLATNKGQIHIQTTATQAMDHGQLSTLSAVLTNKHDEISQIVDRPSTLVDSSSQGVHRSSRVINNSSTIKNNLSNTGIFTNIGPLVTGTEQPHSHGIGVLEAIRTTDPESTLNSPGTADPSRPQTVDITALDGMPVNLPAAVWESNEIVETLPPPRAFRTTAGGPPIITTPSPPDEPGPITPDARGKFFNLQTEGDYMMVSILPMLLATLLSFPIQILTSAVGSILPFRALGQPHGALAADSLCLLRGSGLNAPVIATRFLRQFRDPLPLLNFILTLMSIISIPLSSETIRLEYSTIGPCVADTLCPIGMRRNETPSRGAETLLTGMAVVVVVISWILARWKSGIATEPWSIGTMATLTSTSQEQVRNMISTLPGKSDGGRIRMSDIKDALKGYRFKLGYYSQEQREGAEQMSKQTTRSYGIHVILPNHPPPDRRAEEKGSIRLTARDPPTREALKQAPSRKQTNSRRKSNKNTDLTMQLIIRILALFFHLGLLILILYYETTILDTPFERFIDSQSFGVRILFSSFGTFISLFWDYFFSYMSEYQVYQRLYSSPLSARQSILRPLPSSVLVALWDAIIPSRLLFSKASRTGRKNILMTNITIAAFVAKFTPMLFSAIPFRNTVTWKMHESCTWLAVVTLIYLVLVLFAACMPLRRVISWISCRRKRSRGREQKLGGGARKKFYLPLRPPGSTIAAYMYYLCESRGMLGYFGDGMERLGGKERDRMVDGMGRRYMYGEIVSEETGEKRMGVDYYQVA